MLGSRMWSPKRGFWGGNLGGSRELQYGDQGVPLSLCYESRVNSVKHIGTSRTFIIFAEKHTVFPRFCRGNSVFCALSSMNRSIHRSAQSSLLGLIYWLLTWVRK